jgi:hypothetical protein
MPDNARPMCQCAIRKCWQWDCPRPASWAKVPDGEPVNTTGYFSVTGLPSQMPQCVVGRMDASQWRAACQKVNAAIVSHKATVPHIYIPAFGAGLAVIGIILAVGALSGPGTGEHVGQCAGLCAKWGEKSTWGKTCSVEEIPQWTEDCERSDRCQSRRKLFCLRSEFPTDVKCHNRAAFVTCQSDCCYYNDESYAESISIFWYIWVVYGAMELVRGRLLRNRSQAAMDHALGELNQTVFGSAGFRAAFGWLPRFCWTQSAVFLNDLTEGQGGVQMQSMGAMPVTQESPMHPMPQVGVAMAMAAPVQAPPVLMSVTVPDGMQAGHMLDIMTPAGMQMQVQIPAGVSPGQAFQVQAPAPAVAPDEQDVSVVPATRVV